MNVFMDGVDGWNGCTVDGKLKMNLVSPLENPIGLTFNDSWFFSFLSSKHGLRCIVNLLKIHPDGKDCILLRPLGEPDFSNYPYMTVLTHLQI